MVVLSNNDGCVIARSEEAKALGITMGAPYFQLEALVNRHDIRVFSSNYELYGYPGKQTTWMLRKEHLSPCYTTKWEDIWTVKAS